MRGWGYATVSTASIQADNGQGLTCGIIGLVNKGQPRSLDDWGVLSAWGWGMSKVMDYFETDKAVDSKKVAVQGHSRDGKAALVALAYDERFLTGFISSSGQAGAKLNRRKYGESIENIAATSEYHWMAGNYMKYAGRWDTLPVDSHELIAMVAPRPVFLSTGKGPDLNPDGTVMMMQPGARDFQASRGPIEQQAANINDAWVDSKGTFLAENRNRARQRRHRVPPAFRRTYAGAELAGVFGVRGTIFQGRRRSGGKTLSAYRLPRSLQ
jgi:hypothetical protein